MVYQNNCIRESLFPGFLKEAYITSKYKKGDPTEATNLIPFTEPVSSLQANNYTQVVFVDVSKTVISVPHQSFLNKLVSCGFSTQAREQLPNFCRFEIDNVLFEFAQLSRFESYLPK